MMINQGVSFKTKSEKEKLLFMSLSSRDSYAIHMYKFVKPCSNKITDFHSR